MRRKGSPWTGIGAVLAKETADHFSGWLVWIIVAFLFLTALAAAYTAIATIRQTIGESPFPFLSLLTLRNTQFRWSFIDLVGILVPLVAIALGFDAVGGEFNRRTLSRLLAQPIYRDALLLGKFLAGLLTLAICLVALWLPAVGAGLVLLGVPPGGAETVQTLARSSPRTLYNEIALALLHPSTRSRGPVFLSQLQGAILGAPLPMGQSFLLVWPQLAGLGAGMIPIFAIACVAFQRQEIRA